MQSPQYHLFSLPPELLESLTPRNLFNKPPRAPTPEPTPVAASSGPRSCNVCLGVTFTDVKDQRVHFRSDWHRYNVKTRLNGGKTVSEAEFSQLVDLLEDSLSGSASSSEDDDSDDAVDTLVNKAKRLEPVPENEETPIKQAVSALTWFHSPPATQIGVYRSLFPLGVQPERYLDELKAMQTAVDGGRMWAMFMVAGGHFAGAVIRVSKDEEDSVPESEGAKKKKPKRPKPEVEMLLHKTFHRYTTRRKQGGSQSTNDNAKGPAKSAGALLRRYGEQALRDDIRNLLGEWSEYLAQCERIWIRASTSNRRIFYDYDEAPFEKTDERLRGFPFPTRRPTQSEIQRCLNELIHPKISFFTEEELRAQDEAYFASLPKARPVPQPSAAPSSTSSAPKPVKLSKEEELFRDRWTRVLDMVYKNRLEPLKAFLEKDGGLGAGSLGENGVNSIIPEWMGDRRATILQVAAQSGHEEMTQWLLEEGRADPTIPVSAAAVAAAAGEGEGEGEATQRDASESASASTTASFRRTAYDLAPSKTIRDIFRRAAAAHPDKWDWFGAARVPSALTQEQEEEQEQKKKVRRKGLKDKVRERVAKEKEKDGADAKGNLPQPEPVLPKPVEKEVGNSTARRLGGNAGAVEGVAGLSKEMQMKVERERRARAIEARMKAQQGGG